MVTPSRESNVSGPAEGDDLSLVLKRLMSAGTRKKAEARKKLANDEMTRSFLEAGLRLVAQQFAAPERESQNENGSEGETSAFFRWLAYRQVAEEAQRVGIDWANEAKLRDRWPFRDDFIEDLLAYSLWVKHWAPNIAVAHESAKDLADESVDVVDAIEEAAYREIEVVLENSNILTSLITAAISDRYPYLKEASGKSYRLLHEHWIPIYKTLFESHGLQLRPGISYEELADILSGLSEGLSLRIRADPDCGIVDHEARQTLLGKAAIMLIVGGIDTGDGQELNAVVRQLVQNSRGDLA